MPRIEQAVCAALLLVACHRATYKKVIVLGVDGMDPVFVEHHWADLPHLAQLRSKGGYSHLATTNPPQSPVAWSTFITGLDPAEHGIFDFVHRDPATLEPYLSTDKTIEPRFTFPLGPYRLPLSSSRVASLRKGRAFWGYLDDRGIPVTIVRIPANYPPSPAGNELAGMGAPDLLGTQGTFSFYTDDPDETSRPVSGGEINRVELNNGHVQLQIAGPANSLRRDKAPTTMTVEADVDSERPWMRLEAGAATAILREGEWSGWLPAAFPLLPHAVSAHGMFRVFAKQLHPRFELYVSPVNVDPEHPALPISSPNSFAHKVAERIGPWSTLGIPEDTAALRQGVFDLPQFLSQTRLVLNDERRLLDDALNHFTGGFLFFYFSSVDQNSHMLWGRHDHELLDVYRVVDAAIGEVMRREPGADLMVMSDHGFAAFNEAVNLNTWLIAHGFGDKAYALGLNGLYLKEKTAGPEIRRQLLSWQPVIRSVDPTNASPDNRAIAPDFLVGYRAGYRASWQTALGEAPDGFIDHNNDAWIADHCIDPSEVPAVLFTTRRTYVKNPALRDLPVSLLELYGISRPSPMKGHSVFDVRQSNN